MKRENNKALTAYGDRYHSDNESDPSGIGSMATSSDPSLTNGINFSTCAAEIFLAPVMPPYAR